MKHQEGTDLIAPAEQLWSNETIAAALDDWARRLRAFIANPTSVTEPVPNYALLEMAAEQLRAIASQEKSRG